VREQCWYVFGERKPFKACTNPALYRGPTAIRCSEHGGHLDYTDRWNGDQWEPWSPVHSLDPVFPLPGISTCEEAESDEGHAHCIACGADLTIDEIWGFELPRACDACVKAAYPDYSPEVVV
jgi:hypothetical protein